MKIPQQKRVRGSSGGETFEGSQLHHGECVAALAVFGEYLYVKVLIYMYIFQDRQGCQLSLPRGWQSSLAAFENRLDRWQQAILHANSFLAQWARKPKHSAGRRASCLACIRSHRIQRLPMSDWRAMTPRASSSY
jgi:hypothetical protein